MIVSDYFHKFSFSEVIVIGIIIYFFYSNTEKIEDSDMFLFKY